MPIIFRSRPGMADQPLQGNFAYDSEFPQFEVYESYGPNFFLLLRPEGCVFDADAHGLFPTALD